MLWIIFYKAVLVKKALILANSIRYNPARHFALVRIMGESMLVCSYALWRVLESLGLVTMLLLPADHWAIDQEVWCYIINDCSILGITSSCSNKNVWHDFQWGNWINISVICYFILKSFIHLVNDSRVADIDIHTLQFLSIEYSTSSMKKLCTSDPTLNFQNIQSSIQQFGENCNWKILKWSFFKTFYRHWNELSPLSILMINHYFKTWS